MTWELLGAPRHPGVMWHKEYLLEEAWRTMGRCVPEQLCLAITRRVERGAHEPFFAMPVMETMLDEGYGVP